MSARLLTAEAKDDLLARGYSRRQLGRIAMVFGAGAAAAATMGVPSWAAPAPSISDIATKAKIRLGANECWTGPFEPAQKAAIVAVAVGNRYDAQGERNEFIETVSQVEGVPGDHVSPWPGSSDPLSRSVVTFCSPTRGLVTADPTFELAGSTAEWLNAPVNRVPLRPDYAHDVKAMLAANPKAGLFYICTPNNPTGTVTPVADIEWLVANKPAGSMVLIDEAYTHFADVPTCSHLVAAGKDVVVLRTFSKIFGMAGMRMGYMMARPEIIKSMMRYDGGMQSGALPKPSLVCGTASLTEASLIAARRKEMREARDMTFAHLKARNIAFIPSNANMFMIDWKTKTPKEMQAAFLAQSIQIGRTWPVWPTMSRVTVGSMSEMTAFCAGLDKVWV